ncbi:MAG TPA: glycosyltransferase family 2 protein [Opitutaceae bacterium]|jgi:glycosyltransferase involved in cell wall biosynthesis
MASIEPSTTANTPPRISVLIPTFRYARFLSEAVDSILAQDERNFELLISDDASDDGTAEMLPELAKRDRRIRIWNQPRNLGMVVNWNFLLKEARGRYVQFVFGDDRLQSPHALRKMAAMLDCDADAVLACCARALIDESSGPIGSQNDLGPDAYFTGDPLISRCLQEERNVIGEATAVMFRRSAAARGFDPALRRFVDLEMWLHLLRGGGATHTAETLAGVRLHAAQATIANSRGRWAAVDFLVMVARYHGHLVTADGLRPHSWEYRRRLFRQIYEARKAGRRPREGARAEGELLGRLGRWWYAVCWVRHRLGKPARTLRRRPPQEPEPSTH